MSNTFYCATVSQAEVDQRSREARLRLEYIEALLVPGIRVGQSRLRLSVRRLCWVRLPAKFRAASWPKKVIRTN